MATSTPWGTSHGCSHYAKGIVKHHTASHGGFHVSKPLNEKIPVYMRAADGWYEEDCEWAKVAVCFPEFFPAEHVEAAKKTLRDWDYKAYEKFYGVKLKKGESYEKDQERFYNLHRNDYIVICAFGNWHKAVPKGYVGVVAVPGGNRSNRAGEKCFMIPEKEYNRNTSYGFVIEPAKHKEVSKSVFD